MLLVCTSSSLELGVRSTFYLVGYSALVSLLYRIDFAHFYFCPFSMNLWSLMNPIVTHSSSLALLAVPPTAIKKNKKTYAFLSFIYLGMDCFMLHVNSLEGAEEYLLFVVWTFIFIRSTLMEQSWSYRHIKIILLGKLISTIFVKTSLP